MMPNAARIAAAAETFGAPVPLDRRGRELRRLVVRGLAGGGRGHLGTALSAIEILRVLYDDVLRHDPRRPDWPQRDRCILSKGHGCLALYAVLASHGYFAPEELDRFCHFDGMLGGHPEAAKVPGVEASTGALGHGPSIAVGIALALRQRGSDAKVFAITGDGEINEGSVWEAALAASKHGLDNLAICIDYNKHQSYAATEQVLPLEPLADKWRAFGFAVGEIDGHDVPALRLSLARTPFVPNRPSALICHTVKGRGVAEAENNLAWHHKSNIGADETAALLAAIGRDANA